MKAKIKELLAVPDLTEEEQWAFLRKYVDPVYEMGSYCPTHRKMYLADLAFRLRDEANDDVALLEGQRWVYLAHHYKSEHWDDFKKTTSFAESQCWFGYKEAQPIHWIIAALIAKKLAK